MLRNFTCEKLLSHRTSLPALTHQQSMNEQLQSPLFRLPCEIRQWIYNYALTSSSAITNPTKFKDNSTKDQNPPLIGWRYPVLGLSLSQTCQRIYHEFDIEPFFANNRFAFTAPHLVHAFLTTLYEIGQIGLLSDLAFDMRYATNIPLPGCPVSERSTHTAEWRNPIRIPGPPPGTTNPEYDVPGGSEFVEWEHYLSCMDTIEYPFGGFLCTVLWYDTLLKQGFSCNRTEHFVDTFWALDGLRVLTIDFVEMQRNMLRECETPRFEVGFPRVLDGFVDLLLSVMRSGIEVRVRMLDCSGNVAEIVVCDAADEETCLAIVEGMKGGSAGRKWTREGLLEILFESYDNKAGGSSCSKEG